MHDRTRYERDLVKMSEDALILSEDEEDDDLDSESSEESSSEKSPDNYDLEETISKWTNYIHGWQDRWLTLKDGTLSYYKSRNDIHLGCRGSISLGRAEVELHQFDELRFDLSINDSVWYLRTKTPADRHRWLEALEQQRNPADDGSLQRQGSMLSLHSVASLASTSSFKKGRGLKEKLAEMETFRDILCRQVDTLQGYFDSCADGATSEGSVDGHSSSDDPSDDQTSISDPVASEIHTHVHWSPDGQLNSAKVHPNTTDGHQNAINGHLNASNGILKADRAPSPPFWVGTIDDVQWPGRRTHIVDGELDELGTTPTPEKYMNGPTTKDRDYHKPASVPQTMAIDFKGEAFTFKATTTGILATLSHCIDLMRQREEQWQKRLDKEQERKRKAIEAYKTVSAQLKKKVMVLGGPDYEEGPHSLINEDEFFDAVDAALDLNEKVEAEKRKDKKPGKSLSNGPVSHISEDNPPYQHRLSKMCDDKVEENIRYAFEDIENDWDLIHQDGEMKIYKSEQEIDGVVCDPLKATHTIRNVTAHEMCHTFWDVNIRMDWDATLDFSNTLETLGPDTILSHQAMKRVWPSTQRDLTFLSHIRRLDLSSVGVNDVGSTIVVNCSVDHPESQSSKYIRAKINVSMLCQTFLDPPNIDKKKATRKNLVCKIYYVAHVNPGGWAPATVLRAVYKRVYPKFVTQFSNFVIERRANEPIMW